MQILLVEDEKSLSNAIVAILEQNGYIVEPVLTVLRQLITLWVQIMI